MRKIIVQLLILLLAVDTVDDLSTSGQNRSECVASQPRNGWGAALRPGNGHDIAGSTKARASRDGSGCQSY